MAASVSVSPAVVTLDGSQGEGGGQILRNAIAYAAILGKELHVNKIRAGRSKPGLRAQHVTGLRLVSEISGGRLEGAELHSQSIRYKPPDATSRRRNHADQRKFLGDTKTAGSICLLLQAALPCALLACRHPCRLVLKGGTNATLSPQYDYWLQVFLPTLQAQLGYPPNLVLPKVLARGYFPQGGGTVEVQTQPWNRPIPPIALTDRGTVCDLHIRSFVAGTLPRHMAESMAKSATRTLRPKLGTDIVPRVDIVMEENVLGSGSGILVVAKTTTGCLLAGSALGNSKKRAQSVGIEAANELASTLADGGCVDEWLQDQLIFFMALADGTSEVVTGSLTLHTQTAIWIAEQVCGAKFQVTRLSADDDDEAQHKASPAEESYGQDGRIPGRHHIRCEGVAYVHRME